MYRLWSKYNYLVLFRGTETVRVLSYMQLFQLVLYLASQFVLLIKWWDRVWLGVIS